jgi:glucokinase
MLAELNKVKRHLSGPVRAICLSIAGIVDPKTHLISMTRSIRGWHDVGPPAWLRKFGAPLLVENEANMAAFGEFHHGAAAGTDVAMFLALGAGIGAGLIVDGKLFRGATGAAGEIGLSRLSNGSGRGALDRKELESEAAVPALLASYNRLQGAHLDDPVALFQLSASGDKVAQKVTDTALDYLAFTVANAVLVVNPQRVVVGGGLATAGDLLLTALRERTTGLLAIEAPEIVLSRLGPDAALIGASTLAAQHAAEQLVRELES